jgi:hypothetical protein
MNTLHRYVTNDLLAQVELLVLFHPSMQTGGVNKPPETTYPKATHCWITASVYGRPGRSDLTKKPVIEDMRVETADGEDLEPMLSDSMITDIADYVLSV